MGFSIYTANALLNAMFGKTSDFGALASAPTVYLALFTSEGSTEVSGGSYARKSTAAADWNAASGGLIDNATEQAFPEATADWGTITDVKLYDAASAGNVLADSPLVDLTSKAAFVADGGDDTLDIPNHGFSDNDTVRVFGDNLPTGLSQGTLYYVITSTADTLQLSLTQGGAAINFTTDGYGQIAKTAYQTIVSGNTVRFAAGDLDVSLTA